MLVMIKEKKTALATRYILSEPQTGLEREWLVPKELNQKQINDILVSKASLLEQEAEQKLQALQSPAPTETPYVPLAELTVEQYSKVFMDRKAIDIAEYTRNSWQGCFDVRINPRMGHIRMRDVTPGDIEDFFIGLKREGLKHNSVLMYYTVLKQFFKSARRRGDIPVNPMDMVDRPAPRKDEIISELPQSYSPEKIQYILDCLHQEPLKWQVYVLLLCDTGMRRGECCALTWNDFDFKANTVRIQSNACYTKSQNVYLTTPKNKKSRTVDVDPDVLLYVRFLYMERMQESETISPFLFPHRFSDAKPMLPCSATTYFARFGRKYEIENLNPHRMRHSYASIAITNGADVASVAELLGHSDKAFTLRRYTHADPGSMRKASDIRRRAVKKANLLVDPADQLKIEEFN